MSMRSNLKQHTQRTESKSALSETTHPLTSLTIREARVAAGFATLVLWSTAVDSDISTISKVERGHLRPHPALARNIAAVLGWTTEQVLSAPPHVDPETRLQVLLKERNTDVCQLSTRARRAFAKDDQAAFEATRITAFNLLPGPLGLIIRGYLAPSPAEIAALATALDMTDSELRTEIDATLNAVNETAAA